MSLLLRRALLAQERNTFPRLSPDGQRIVFIRTDDAGQELWLRANDGSEHQLAAHHGEMITDLRWTADGSVLLYRCTERGRESWRLTGMRMGSLERIRLPASGPVAEYWLAHHDSAVVVYTSRGDLIRADLADRDAQPVVIAKNPGYHRWLVDGQARPRGGTRLTEDGSAHVLLGDDLDSARSVLKLEVEEVIDLSIQGFSRDGERLFLLTSYGAATRRLIAIDSSSAAVHTVYEHAQLDIESYPIAGEGVWFDPRTGEPDVCTVMDQRLHYHALSPEMATAVRPLAATPHDSAVIIDRSADDRTWLIVYVRDNGPISYHAFDPASGKSEPLFDNRPDLAGHRLPKLEDFHYVAGDGRPLSGYLMRPLDCDGPLPTVVMVHGGPAGRDLWRFYADAQYLASLGYLSLHINYRGSRGFGIDFRQSGNGEWGGRMQEDLYDAVSVAISRGLVDGDRVAFLGASYGGYAALLGSTARPDLVRCAIAISAPCDLVSFVQKPPPYWQPLSILLRRQISQLSDGRQLNDQELARRSPIHTLSKSSSPILLAHGIRDPRVPEAEVDRFVAKAQAMGVPVRYLRFADEGHHVKSNANRAVLFRAIEEFLEAHLAIR
ncbi:peptidase S9 [Rhizocola hellebori]|uniref:Peptidase S9 n=1 Tax=Rhizocola hellebori TaxID=1392758 RepID=A0A8J3QEF7_9ACTN|nr:alpha/beta fold hydrolase [Rhizocola hellebori]GIH08209.1 peptidase S9 [Rhizocola hellebori]